MTFDEYQAQAKTTLIKHPDETMNQTILAMGIVGEAGEMIDKWKKIQSYFDGEVNAETLQELGREIGDILWYIATFADSLGLKLSDIAQTNLAKLADRKKRNVQRGEGDNR
ncbi:nucleoside triphosphate pyrophosphohydrolase family protein [Candidatus Saccharibacteria bacterium]|nr:nucleoside triphosphate pyrophosphohydrolase family protein [Candidatus Saccharibacteria bacterium]